MKRKISEVLLSGPLRPIWNVEIYVKNMFTYVFLIILIASLSDIE